VQEIARREALHSFVPLPAERMEPSPCTAVAADWKQALPVLNGRGVSLRQLETADAASLFTMLTSDEVTRFISPPPSSVEGFDRFIAWSTQQRIAGGGACFAVTVKGSNTAVGILQLRETAPRFGTAEWGFAIGSAFWGRGVFQEAAELMLPFAFDTVGVHRLEARAAVRNGRGNRALVKIGAVREGVLRNAFHRDGDYIDQALYAIVADDWRVSRTTSAPSPLVRIH
jgi:ribosomal-protein-alanine N-acetyltransferase